MIREPAAYTVGPPRAETELVEVGDILRIFEVCWRRKWLIVLFGILGAAAGGAYFMRSAAVYQSSARVLVVQKRPYVVAGVDQRANYVEDDFSTHVTLLTSPLFIEKAVTAHKLDQLPTFSSVRSPVNAIASKLTVSRFSKDAINASSTILDLSFRGPVAEDCPAVISSIVETYGEFLKQGTQTANKDSLALITQKAEEVKRELEELDRKLQELRTAERPEGLRVKNASALLEKQIQERESQRSAISLKRLRLERQMSEVNAAIAAGASRDDLLQLILAAGEGEKNDNYLLLQEKLFPLQLKEKQLLEDYTATHPEVQLIREQIEMTRKMFGQRIGPTRGATDPSDVSKVKDPVAAFIANIRHDVTELKREEETLTTIGNEQNEKLLELEAYEEKEKALTSDIARTEQFHETLMRQLQGVNLAKDFVGNSVSAIAPASFPVQVEPKPLFVFSIPTALGLFVGFLFALCLDAMDKSFRNADELQRRLRVPVVGHVPQIPTGQFHDDSDFDPQLVAYFSPASPEAEAFRGIRTALYFSDIGAQNRVIQMASPNVGDGKSLLSANLAVSIAQSQRRCLLIDADLRNPQQNLIFGVNNDVGVASVINGDVELADAIQSLSIPNLSFLPAGPAPSNPSELLTSPRMGQLLKDVRDQYDFVLIDTPALLAVSDGSCVAARVDGVLLVIRVTKNGRPSAERAAELLSTIGASVVGIVVNGADFGANFKSSRPRYNYFESYQFDRKALKYYAKQQGLARLEGRR